MKAGLPRAPLAPAAATPRQRPPGAFMGAAVMRLHRAAGNRVVGAMVSPAAGRKLSRKLIDHASKAELSAQTIAELKLRHPGRAAEMDTLHALDALYTVREYGRRLTISPYHVPTPWHPQMPSGYLPSGGPQSMSDAAREAGHAYTFERGSMPATLTQQVSGLHPTGVSFEGGGAIRGGSSLSKAGLERTHHLSDSAVRRIIADILHKGTWTRHVVCSWFEAVGGPGSGIGLYQEFIGLAERQDIPALEKLANTLSNSPWQMGLGPRSFNNPISDRFDESVTASGMPTPVASLIAQMTRALATHGAVDEGIVNAALSQLVSTETGVPMRSMTVNVHEGQTAYLPSSPFSGGPSPFASHHAPVYGSVPPPVVQTPHRAPQGVPMSQIPAPMGAGAPVPDGTYDARRLSLQQIYTLAVHVPGNAGEFLRDVLDGGGQAINDFMGTIVFTVTGGAVDVTFRS